MGGVVKASPLPGRCLKAIESLPWVAWMVPFSNSACTQPGLPWVGALVCTWSNMPNIFYSRAHTMFPSSKHKGQPPALTSHILNKYGHVVLGRVHFTCFPFLSPKTIHRVPGPFSKFAFFPPLLPLPISLIALYTQYKLLFKYFGPDVV